jgi:hypothetical protein
LKVPDCDKGKLEAAWTEWRRLGEYYNGEDQRKDLFFTSRDWAERWLLYQSLKKGMAGTRGERRAFEEEWTSSALQQMEDDPNWEMWCEIEELEESPLEPSRRVGHVRDHDYLHPEHPDKHLGRRCYAA